MQRSILFTCLWWNLESGDCLCQMALLLAVWQFLLFSGRSQSGTGRHRRSSSIFSCLVKMKTEQATPGLVSRFQQTLRPPRCIEKNQLPRRYHSIVVGSASGELVVNVHGWGSKGPEGYLVCSRWRESQRIPSLKEHSLQPNNLSAVAWNKPMLVLGASMRLGSERSFPAHCLCWCQSGGFLVWRE